MSTIIEEYELWIAKLMIDSSVNVPIDVMRDYFKFVADNRVAHLAMMEGDQARRAYRACY